MLPKLEVVKPLDGPGWKVFETKNNCSADLNMEEPASKVVRSEVGGTQSKRESVYLEVNKGITGDCTDGRALTHLFIGSGVKCSDEQVKMQKNGPARQDKCSESRDDLGITAALYDQQGKQIAAVDCASASMYGISLSGDDDGSKAAEAGHEDLAFLTMDLAAVPAEVAQVYFVLTAATTFQAFKSSYARVCDQSTQSLARYEISQYRSFSGFIIGRVFRQDGEFLSKPWTFQPIGRYVEKERKYEVIELLLRVKEDKQADEAKRCRSSLTVALARGRHSKMFLLESGPLMQPCLFFDRDQLHNVRHEAEMQASLALSCRQSFAETLFHSCGVSV